MKRESIDDIIWNAKTGLFINTTQIEKAARELVESRLSDLANVDIMNDKENLDWGFQLKDLTDRGCRFRKFTYIDIIRSVNELSDGDNGINADIFMFIAFLGALIHRIHCLDNASGEIEVPVKMLVTRARTERPHGALLQVDTESRYCMYRIGGRLRSKDVSLCGAAVGIPPL